MHDHGDVGRLFFRRYTDALHLGRENGDRDGDAILDQHLGGIEIGAELKGDAQRHVAVARALRRHVEHVLNAIDLLFDRRRNRFRYHLRVGAGIGGRDLDRWWRNRKRRKRDHADERDDDADDAREDRPVDEEVRKVHSNSEFGIRNAEFLTRLQRAVLIDATVMAINSLASCLPAVSFAAPTSWDSSSNSSQNRVSSASSSTMPIFAMKSAVDFARQAARFAATDVPERTICDARARPAVVLGNASTSFKIRSANAFVRFFKSGTFRIPYSAFTSLAPV